MRVFFCLAAFVASGRALWNCPAAISCRIARMGSGAWVIDLFITKKARRVPGFEGAWPEKAMPVACVEASSYWKSPAPSVLPSTTPISVSSVDEMPVPPVASWYRNKALEFAEV